MSDETLLTASRRVVRFFNIDMNGGGLITVETQHAVETLDKMVRIEAKKEQANANNNNGERSISDIGTKEFCEELCNTTDGVSKLDSGPISPQEP